MKQFIHKYYPFFINIYTIWILYMMFFAYNRGNGVSSHYEIHPYPFQSIRSVLRTVDDVEIFKNIVGNIVLFIPYGFLGLLYPKFNRYRYLFFTFLLAINYLEFCQYYFKRGYAELDDVLLNVSGMTIGFLLYASLQFRKIL